MKYPISFTLIYIQEQDYKDMNAETFMSYMHTTRWSKIKMQLDVEESTPASDMTF